MEPTARRLHRLVEPIHLVTYFSDEPTDALRALGHRNYWDGYFAGRAAPLGRVPAEVVHAIFYNFAEGEVARHIPRVWDVATPEAALAAREQGSVAALRRILGDLAAPAYDSLEPSELDRLIADLEPISAALDAVGSR
jgi:hypothetical protein